MLQTTSLVAHRKLVVRHGAGSTGGGRCLESSSRWPVTLRAAASQKGQGPPRPTKLARDAEKEDSRKYRRTHFNHELWATHRSTSRYWRHVQSGLLTSRIVRGLRAPLAYVALISAAVCSYETALVDKLLPQWGFAWPSLSVAFAGPFSLSTFALSLLLVFRTNSSYQRWNDARKLWGLCINRSRDAARQALQWCSDDDAALAAGICRLATAFPYALMCSVREDVQLEACLKEILLPHELQLVLTQQHPGTAVLQALGAYVRLSGMKEVQKLRLDENITVLQDVMGGCERIFRTPVPLSFTRHTSRFLVCWLTCLPFCVAEAMGWTTVPVACGLAFFLFGIEEIGVQIEEPFGILSLEIYCDTIRQNIGQALELAAPIRAAAAETARPPAITAAGSSGGSSGGGSSSSSSSSSGLTGMRVAGFQLAQLPAAVIEVGGFGLVGLPSSSAELGSGPEAAKQLQLEQQLQSEQEDELALGAAAVVWPNQDEPEFM